MISIDCDKIQCATLSNLSDEYKADFELFFENVGNETMNQF